MKSNQKDKPKKQNEAYCKPAGRVFNAFFVDYGDDLSFVQKPWHFVPLLSDDKAKEYTRPDA
ncbi:MAG: hypothetical protein GF398_00895 [Chitinivibrionales bacterium]|nr:hypothetical protein [Chitinivibrionales bacterium]